MLSKWILRSRQIARKRDSAPPTRAFRGDALGDLETFRLCEIARPSPAEGEILLAVEATALGYVDLLIMRGLYQVKPPVPFTPGGEIVGRVEEIGAGVTGFAVGDRVACWQFGGGLAEHAIVEARNTAPVPAGLQATQAAALLLDCLTAYHGLFDRGKLQPGQTVIVTGASGGVGSAAVQLAKAASAQVVALASGSEKVAFVAALGANHVINYREPDWRETIRTLYPGGVELVFDPVGGSLFEKCFRSLAKRGRHLVVGFASEDGIPSLPANLALLKSGELVGVDARYLSQSDPDRVRRILSIIMEMAVGGSLKPPIWDTFPLSEASSAVESVSSRDRIGKVVVVRLPSKA